jgi:hypothetical protein
VTAARPPNKPLLPIEWVLRLGRAIRAEQRNTNWGFGVWRSLEVVGSKGTREGAHVSALPRSALATGRFYLSTTILMV